MSCTVEYMLPIATLQPCTFLRLLLLSSLFMREQQTEENYNKSYKYLHFRHGGVGAGWVILGSRVPGERWDLAIGN